MIDNKANHKQAFGLDPSVGHFELVKKYLKVLSSFVYFSNYSRIKTASKFLYRHNY